MAQTSAAPPELVARLDFDLLTRVVKGPGDTVVAELDPSIRGAYFGIHGGYLACILLRAMWTSVPEGHAPRSFTCQLPRPARVGPISAEVGIEHRGRSSTATTVKARQGASTIALGHAVFGAAIPTQGDSCLRGPAVAAPEKWTPAHGPAPWLGIEQRPVHCAEPESANAAWMRLRDDRPLDMFSATVLADGMLPVVATDLDGELAAPTAELSIHFGAIPRGTASPWALGIFRNRQCRDGWAVEDGEIWTRDGVLALSSRQLRRVLSTRDTQVPGTRAAVREGGRA
ncbi:MAG TPA: thioesterase family protein [Pseudonocardiaceae bacterium]|nr:thioesterase family protein [Pseudonocardiaceae bacterium]